MWIMRKISYASSYWTSPNLLINLLIHFPMAEAVPITDLQPKEVDRCFHDPGG